MNRRTQPPDPAARAARRLGPLLAAGLVGSATASVLGATPAAAGHPVPNQVVVTTTADVVDPGDGLLSLREAIDVANTDGQSTDVVLAPGATYVLDECGGGTDEQDNVGGDLDHTAEHELRIVGNGATIRQTCSGERVIHHWPVDGSLVLSDVRITGGRTAGSGGGALSGGTLSIRDAVIEDNVAAGPNGGGGVASVFDLSVVRSIVRDNVAGGMGGGVRAFGFVGVTASTIAGNAAATSGGGVSAGTTLNLQRSTVTGNRAGTVGGGLTSASAGVEVGASTVTANRAPTGANVHAGGAVRLRGSIVALGSDGLDCASGEPVLNEGGNLGFDPSCGAAQPDDLAAMHPMVGPLVIPTGSNTASRRPVVGSPAVDRFAAPCAGEVDQHGTARPQGSGCDSGSVEATPPACTPSFSDVSGAHPFFAEICWLDQSGISTGYADGSYGAAQPVSRQAMAAFLHRLALSPPPPVPLPSFPDVPAGHPFQAEIGWLADQGISTGYADGTFRPGDVVTRQAMAAFLYRVAGEPGVVLLDGMASFSDVSSGHPFFVPIEWMAQAGVSTGYADGTWQPAAAVSRQAMAAFLQRMAEHVQLRGL